MFEPCSLGFHDSPPRISDPQLISPFNDGLFAQTQSPQNSSHEPLQKLTECKGSQNMAKSDAKSYKTQHKEPETHVKGMTTA